MKEDDIEEVSLFEEAATPEVEEPVPEVEAAPEPEFKVPEKFAGKSIEDVIEAYTNLEKEHGRKANEVGELRKLTDDILRKQVDVAPIQETVPDIHDVGFEDFIDDPASAVNRALDGNPRLKALEEAISTDRQQKTHTQLLQRHQDADQLVQTPEFSKWVSESPTRARMFQEAHVNYDVAMASDLLDMYKTTRSLSTEDAIAERNARASEALSRATVEKGGAGGASKKPRYKRAELIRLKIEQPARYAAMADEIRQAYADKRVI